jgi:hypothetical protein
MRPPTLHLHLRREALVMILLALALALFFLLMAPAVRAASRTGTISGSAITAAGKPVAGVAVTLYQYTAVGPEWWTWDQVQGFKATTARNGAYTLKVPAGRYHVLFTPGDLHKYAIEAYPNAPGPDFGDDVVVRYGATTRRVNAILDAPAHIEGQVVDATTGAGVGGVSISCTFQGEARIQCLIQDADVSEADGSFEVWGLKPYDGFMLTPDTGSLPFWAPMFQRDVDEFSFAGDPAGVRTNKVFVESTAIDKLTGRVVCDPQDGSEPFGVAGLQVFLYEVWDDGGWDNEPMASTQTGAGGLFTFRSSVLQLETGSNVLVQVVDPEGTYWDVWYWRAPDDGSAQWVGFTLGQTTDLGDVPTTFATMAPPY